MAGEGITAVNCSVEMREQVRELAESSGMKINKIVDQLLAYGIRVWIDQHQGQTIQLTMDEIIERSR